VPRGMPSEKCDANHGASAQTCNTTCVWAHTFAWECRHSKNGGTGFLGLVLLCSPLAALASLARVSGEKVLADDSLDSPEAGAAISRAMDEREEPEPELCMFEGTKAPDKCRWPWLAGCLPPSCWPRLGAMAEYSGTARRVLTIPPPSGCAWLMAPASSDEKPPCDMGGRLFEGCLCSSLMAWGSDGRMLGLGGGADGGLSTSTCALSGHLRGLCRVSVRHTAEARAGGMELSHSKACLLGSGKLLQPWHCKERQGFVLAKPGGLHA
jgi:hypothetical protein